MIQNTFGTYRSINNRLHNQLSQQHQYSRYLKRIENIVDKKNLQDKSSSFYMTFLRRTKCSSRIHNTNQKQISIGRQNKHLLDKIVRLTKRKTSSPHKNYSLAMHQKRHRQQNKINQQNRNIAKRITQQYSLLRKKNLRSMSNSSLGSSKKTQKESWQCMALKRKLPKIMPLRH